MPAEIQIISTLDNSDTIAGFVETEKKANETAKSTENAVKANKSFQQQLRELKKESQGIDLEEKVKKVKAIFESSAPSVQKLKLQIKEYQAIALEAGLTSPIGREFIELAAQARDELGDLQQQTNNLANDTRRLQGVIEGIGVGVSVFAGVTAATALFGGENKELEKILIQVTAAQTLMNSVQAIANSLQAQSSLRLAIDNGLLTARTAALGVLSAAQTAYTAVVGTSTGVMKAFRIALIATGIGAIVVLIGLLIANFESIVGFVQTAIQKFGGLKNTLLLLLGPIGLIIAAWKFLFGEEEKVEDSRQKQSEENARRTKKRIEEIKAEQKAFVTGIKKENEILEVKVKILENEGKNSDEVRLKILENNRAVIQSQIEAVRQIIAAKTEQYRAEARLRGQSDEEFIKSMKQRGVDLILAQKDANQIVTDLELKAKLSESEITKFKRDQQKERSEIAKKAADDQKKIDDELLQRRIDALAQIEQIEINSIEDRIQREEAILRSKFTKDTERLSNDIEEERLLRLKLEERLLIDITNLKEKFAEEERITEFKNSQQLDELRIQLLEGRRVGEFEQFQLDKEVSNLRFLEEIENLKFQLTTKELTIDEFNLQRELLEQEHQEKLIEIEKNASELRQKQSQDEAKKKIDTVSFFVDSAISINESFNKIQDNRLKEGEELSLKTQKRRFQREKAFNIASALMNGANAIMQGIATFGPPPSPLGIAAIASAGLVTALQVAAIASTQFNPSGGGGGVSAPSIGGGGGFNIPTSSNEPNLPNTTTNIGNEGSQGSEDMFNSSGGYKVPVIKTYVISGELTSAADAERKIEEQAIL